MHYKIISGKYETGTQIQQQGFCELFGKEDIQFKFDLYFHWFNIIHELGHCLVDLHRADITSMDNVKEELFVNKFAVSYWRMAGGGDKLQFLQEMLSKIISRLPNPIPADKDFVSFFKEQWGSEQMATVALYGYFQLSCVLEVINSEQSLWEILEEIGIHIPEKKAMEIYIGEASSNSAKDVLKLCLKNLENSGIIGKDLKIELELVDNPEIQCVQPTD